MTAVKWLTAEERSQVEEAIGPLLMNNPGPRVPESELREYIGVSDHTVRNHARRGLPRELVNGKWLYPAGHCNVWERSWERLLETNRMPNQLSMKAARAIEMQSYASVFPGLPWIRMPRKTAEIVLRIPFPEAEWPQEIVFDPDAIEAVARLTSSNGRRKSARPAVRSGEKARARERSSDLPETERAKAGDES